MKVLTILGSPRKNATSTAIAKRFNEEATSLGAEVTVFDLNAMAFKGCQGCYGCKTGKKTCVLKDDLTQVFNKMADADVMVFTSPIYHGDITAQLKGYFDRTFWTLKAEFLETGIPASRLPAGKKSLMIITQGAPTEQHAEIPKRYNSYLELSGFSDCRTIREVDRLDFRETAPYPESLELATKAARDFMSA